MPITTDIGGAIIDVLKEVREQKGLNQTYIADLLGVRECTVSRMESGHQDVGMDRICKWAESLGMTINTAILMAERKVKPSSAISRVSFGTDIVGSVSNGVVQHWGITNEHQSFIAAKSRDPKAYALLIEQGECAIGLPGDALLVEPSRRAHSGDKVIIGLGETDGVFCDFVAKRDNMFTMDTPEGRKVIHKDDIRYIHFIAAVFLAGAVSYLTPQTQSEQGDHDNHSDRN